MRQIIAPEHCAIKRLVCHKLEYPNLLKLTYFQQRTHSGKVWPFGAKGLLAFFPPHINSRLVQTSSGHSGRGCAGHYLRARVRSNLRRNGRSCRSQRLYCGPHLSAGPAGAQRRRATATLLTFFLCCCDLSVNEAESQRINFWQLCKYNLLVFVDYAAVLMRGKCCPLFANSDCI